MDKQKLIHQLFIGKVADVLGVEKTSELLKEAKEAFAIPNVVVSKAEVCKCDNQETCLDSEFQHYTCPKCTGVIEEIT